VDSVRTELLGKRVFVFLRNGEIRNLAAGLTALDAACEIGLLFQTVGVEVNGEPVPLDQVLKNADVVNVVTSDDAVVQRDWLGMAKARSTKAKLRAHFYKIDTAAGEGGGGITID
jgi:GTP pyrophosphokinase